MADLIVQDQIDILDVLFDDDKLTKQQYEQATEAAADCLSGRFANNIGDQLKRSLDKRNNDTKVFSILFDSLVTP